MLRDCLDLIDDGYEITHGFRQKNLVADRLADWAYSHRQRQEFYRDRELPEAVRVRYVADRIGIWNYRIRGCICLSF